MNFAYKVSVEIHLARRDVNTLMDAAAEHYDGACRRSGELGGFLRGWHNAANQRGLTTYADFGELDRCLKILEGRKEVALRGRLREALKALLEESRRLRGESEES